MLPYPSLRQGLVGAWCPSLRNSSGMIPDASGFNRNLPKAAGHSFVASPGGVALSTNSVSASSPFNAPAAMTGDVDNTVSVWASPLSVSGSYAFLAFGNNALASNGGIVVFFYQYSSNRLLISTGTNTGEIYVGALPSLGQWQCLTRVKQAGQLAVMYLNGRRLGTGGGQAISSFAIPSAPMVLGASFNGTSGGPSLLDDIRIYNRALTPAEILLLASRRGIGLSPTAVRVSFPQSYPITTPPNRIWSNESGVWTPGSVRANESGSWRNGDVKVNDGGVWITARYHPEAEDWKSRAEAAGGTVSETTLSAVSDFCTAINAAGIRDRMYRLNLFCGGNLAACLTPLYRGPTADGGYGNLYDTNFNFVAGDYQETGASGGLKGNGTNKHLNTGYPANTLAASNTHLGVGVTSDDTLAGTTRTAIGSYNGSANSLEIGLRNATSPSVFFSRFATSTDRMGDNSGAYSLLAKGDLIAAWPQFYRNGVAAGSPATTSQNYPLSHSVAVFANNQANTSVISHTDARLAWYSIGATMTAAQASAFSAATAAFRTALGRA